MLRPLSVRLRPFGLAGASALGAAVLIPSLLVLTAPHPAASGQLPPAGATLAGEPPVVIEKGDFRFSCDQRGVSALANPNDPFKATLMPAAGTRGARPPVLGLAASYRTDKAGGWTDVTSRGAEWKASPEAGTATYASGGPGVPVKVVETFRTDGRVLDWTIDLESTAAAPVEVGDLAVSIPAAGPYGEDPAQIFERGFLRHQFVSGAGSFVYFVRASGAPPYLLVTVSSGNEARVLDRRRPRGRTAVHSLRQERPRRDPGNLAPAPHLARARGRREPGEPSLLRLPVRVGGELRRAALAALRCGTLRCPGRPGDDRPGRPLRPLLAAHEGPDRGGPGRVPRPDDDPLSRRARAGPPRL